MRRTDDEILIEGESFDITRREALVSVILIFIFLSVAILATVKVSDNVQVHNENVGRILCIETPELFVHSVETNVGEAISIAKVQCVDPVSIDDIEGKYSYIEYTKQKYTMHTRQVAHTTTDSKGHTHTYYTTETYWEWDQVDSDDWYSTIVSINGVDYKDKPSRYFKSSYVLSDKYKGDYSRCDGSRWIYLSSHVRICYEVGELESSGVVRCNLTNNSIEEVMNYHYGEESPYEIRESLKTSKSAALTGTWIGFIVLAGIVIFVFVYFDNDWLYSKKKSEKEDFYEYNY